MFDESPSVAWRQRYGSEPPNLPQLEKFLAHRSVRNYTNEPISEEIARGLVAAAQSAATSSNLQLWSVVSIQNPERRETISQLCGDQAHIRTCGRFFAFLADVHRIRMTAQAVEEKADGLDYTEFYTMAIIDAALAAERMVCAAEALGLGICYIGGLRNNPQGVKELLNLPEGVFGVFGLCIGWPAEEPKAEIKPRLSQEAVWFEETYDTTLRTAEYDERAKGFYEAMQMKGDVTWSMRSGRRVGTKQLTGREGQKPWLEEQGFMRR